MTNLLATLQEALRHFPEPPRIDRVEVGQAVLDWLKATSRSEGAPPESPWRQVGWIPPTTPAGSLFGTPVVLCEDMDPSAWRFIDRDGEVVKEWKP